MANDPLTPPRLQPARPSDRMRRLQFGIGGVLVVLLLIGLAGIIGERAADQAVTEATGVPTAASSTATASDQPLVDLGVQPADPDSAAPAATPIQPNTVVPDLPAAPPAQNGQ